MKKETNEIIDTNTINKHGQNKCPKCGASNITYDIEKKTLICDYCHTRFNSSRIKEFQSDFTSLKGGKRGSATEDIKEHSNDTITIKCGGCGAEIVINTKETLNAKCHWCHSNLSVNRQIENGTIPDVILPFQLTREEAYQKMKAFTKKRTFFATHHFKKHFIEEKLVGVFFPYIIIDANCHCIFQGKGERQTDEYTVTVGSGDDEREETRYDADFYKIDREFDILVKNLTIESLKDYINKNNKKETTNIINSIMPFDTENCIKYNANYLIGYSSEKRNINLKSIEPKINMEIKDITRHALNHYLKYYDRGVKWENEYEVINGKQWVSAYLPIWLFSYQKRKGKIHYIAVNARTGETMGSVPISRIKLLIASLIIFSLLPGIGFLIKAPYPMMAIFLFLGIVFFISFYQSKRTKYRNKEQRHEYEYETKTIFSNMKNNDAFLKNKQGLSMSTIDGKNNEDTYGEKIKISEKE